MCIHTHTHTHSLTHSHSLTHPRAPAQIFDINQLDLQKVGKAFGFSVPPNVNLDVHSSKAGQVKSRKSGGSGFGSGFRDHDRRQKSAHPPM